MHRTIGIAALATFASYILCTAAPALSAPVPSSIHETYVVSGPPTAETVRKWSSLPGGRNYLFQIENPTSQDLSTILTLERADLIQVEASAYPNREDLSSWKALAQKHAQFVARDLQLPDPEQVELLNEIGFSRVIFLLSYIPDPAESERLASLHSPVSVTFATSAYPRYDDKALLLAIPKEIPLTFVGNYWPWYTQMDLFNMLPNPQRLRIIGSLPSEDALPYFRNLKNLQEVTIELDFDSEDLWEKLGSVPITWISKDHVPSPAALQAFASSGRPLAAARKLTIDRDTELNSDERTQLADLARASVAVEWVHSVSGYGTRTSDKH